jgi:hypothetical protein
MRSPQASSSGDLGAHGLPRLGGQPALVQPLDYSLGGERRQHANNDDQVFLQELPKAPPRLGFVDVHAAPQRSAAVTVRGLSKVRYGQADIGGLPQGGPCRP